MICSLSFPKSIQGTPQSELHGHPSRIYLGCASIHPSISAISHGPSAQDNRHSVCWRTYRMIQEAVGNNNRKRGKKLSTRFFSLPLLSPAWLCRRDGLSPGTCNHSLLPFDCHRHCQCHRHLRSSPPIAQFTLASTILFSNKHICC